MESHTAGQRKLIKNAHFSTELILVPSAIRNPGAYERYRLGA